MGSFYVPLRLLHPGPRGAGKVDFTFLSQQYVSNPMALHSVTVGFPFRVHNFLHFSFRIFSGAWIVSVNRSCYSPCAVIDRDNCRRNFIVLLFFQVSLLNVPKLLVGAPDP